MNLSAFKNPLVIGALLGCTVIGAAGAYFAIDRPQSCDRLEAMAAQDEALERLLQRRERPSVDPEQYKKNPLPFLERN